MILQTYPDGSSDNLLLYGMTGAGKTTQAAEVLEHMVKESGKPALAYITDWGSCRPLQQLVEQGKIEAEKFMFGQDPLLWIDSAVQGKRFVNGKWVGETREAFAKRYCVVLMESLSGQGELVLNSLGHQVAEGKNVGGDAQKAPSLAIQADGYIIRIPSNSPTHYGMAQKHLLEKVWQSQSLPVPVIWTAHEDIASPAKRDEQGNVRAEVAVPLGVQGMIGPLMAGHALTMHLGKYFVYMFRLRQEVTPAGVKHVLQTTRHKDGLYEGLANNRAPLNANPPIPAMLEPANVVKILQMLQQAQQAA